MSVELQSRALEHFGTGLREDTSHALLYLSTFGAFCLRKFSVLLFLSLLAFHCRAAQFTNGQAARAEFGQQSFTTGANGVSQNLLGAVSGLAFANGLLYVTDSNRVGATPLNNRVLAFDTTQLPIPNQDVATAFHANSYCWVCGYGAVRLYGEVDYATPYPGRAAIPAAGPAGGQDTGSLETPTAVATDGTHFAIADTDNNRVLIWNSVPISQFTSPDIVLGQSSFTAFQTPQLVNANSLRGPQGVWFQNGKVFVADTQNYRVLIWNHMPTSNNQPADLVLGQPNFTSANAPPVTRTNPTAAANQLLNPVSVTSDGTHVFVADLGFNRVLIWNSIPTTQDQPADVVVGQPDMSSTAANNNSAVCTPETTDSSGNPVYPTICEATLNFPRFALSDGTRLFIADGGNDRVLIFNHIPTANGAKADNVLGQPDFISDIVTNQAGSIASTAIDNTGAVDTLPSPTSLAWDGTNLYVADPYNRRVLAFSSGDIALPDNSVLNNASEIIRQEGVVVLTVATVTASDTVTITIQGTDYTYTVKSTDTLDTITLGAVSAINSGSGDPNAIALYAGNGTGTIYLSSRATNLSFDAISLAATTSNSTDLTATASGGYLTAGTGSTASPGMVVEVDAAPGTTLADETAQISGGAWPLSLGGVQVFMDGFPAPLYSVSPTQIVAQVPFIFGDRNSTTVFVRTARADGSITVTNSTPAYIAPANPGLFSAPASPGEPRPWPVTGAMHQAGNPTAVVSIDGSVHATDTATITISGTNYTYTVQSTDTLASIVNGLVSLINASDPNVTASVGSAFTRVVLTAKLDGLSGGNGISVAGSVSSNAQVTVTAYTSATCCAVTPNTPITAQYPAAPGELITVDASGLGGISDVATQVGSQTGQPYSGPTPYYGALSLSVDNYVSATMNGETAQVVGAGFQTGAVGHYSVQMIVPSDAPTNSATQVYIAQNAFISNIATLPVGPATIQPPPLPPPPAPPPPAAPGAGLSNTQILVNPAGLLFATQNVGASLNKTQTVTIANPSSSALSLNGFTITGTNAADFTGSWNCPGTLAAGQSCTVTITYTPGGSGVRTALLSINNSTGGSPQTVSLTGTVVSSFVIVNKGSGKALDLAGDPTMAGTLIEQNDVLGSENQRWTLVPTGSGTYAVMNVLSGRVLDVVLGSSANGASIQQYDYLGFANQQWIVTPTPDGYNEIVNVASGKVLDVTGHSTSDSAFIQQWDYLGGDNQKWQFQTVQLFQIRSLGTGKVLDAPLGSMVPGTPIQQWDYLSGANQQWLLIPVDNTYYRIVNSRSGLVLDVTGASNSAGTPIQEYTYLGFGNQLWALSPTSSGYYTIVCQQSGRVLDVTQGSTANGTLIQQYDYLGGTNQQWQLIPVTQ